MTKIYDLFCGDDEAKFHLFANDDHLLKTLEIIARDKGIEDLSELAKDWSYNGLINYLEKNFKDDAKPLINEIYMFYIKTGVTFPTLISLDSLNKSDLDFLKSKIESSGVFHEPKIIGYSS